MNVPDQFDQVEVLLGGMGVGISSPELAKAVALAGKGRTAGITSATVAAHMAMSKLVNEDSGYLRALDAFEKLIPEAGAYIREWVSEKMRNKCMPIGIPLYSRSISPRRTWANIFGGFAVTFLASEGHEYPIGVNVLEKVQHPHLEHFMGVLLAFSLRSPNALSFIIAGAGLPWQFPRVLRDLAQFRSATYEVDCLVVKDGKEARSTRQEVFTLSEHTAQFSCETRNNLASLELTAPPVIAIVTMFTAASILEKKSDGEIAGYVVENERAGGHNAPPRDGRAYGPKDTMDVGKLQALHKPFWFAGDWGSPEGLKAAQDAGAVGIQCGSLFSLAEESGFLPEIKRRLVQAIENDELHVERDDRASPTGFPFNVVHLEGTTGDPDVAKDWKRSCDVGHLRVEVQDSEGKTSYRCSAEPVHNYVQKGGKEEDTVGRQCLCRQLLAAGGFEHHLRRDYRDQLIATFGLGGAAQVARFLKHSGTTSTRMDRYTAKKVVSFLLGGLA